VFAERIFQHLAVWKNAWWAEAPAGTRSRLRNCEGEKEGNGNSPNIKSTHSARAGAMASSMRKEPCRVCEKCNECARTPSDFAYLVGKREYAPLQWLPWRRPSDGGMSS
jgi:hypothetical protein